MHAMLRSRFSALLIIGGILVLSGVRSAVAAGPATAITLSPTTATMTSDQSQEFTVTATDAAGQTQDVTKDTTFSTNDPLGSISGAKYFAGKAGTWTVQGSYQSFTVTANVTVTPGAAQELSINPSSQPEYVDLNGKKTFTVEGFDEASNKVPNLSPKWYVLGEIGSIDAHGVFTAKKVGTGKIQATVGTITGEVAVVVKTAAPAVIVSNTNRATNGNRNTNQSTNANANVNSNTNTPAPVTNTSDCKTLSTWVWVIILIVYLLAVAVLYALVPINKIWPAAVGLGGAIVLIFIQRHYGCGILSWWAWMVALATLAMTLFAARQLPMPSAPSKQ